MMVFCPIEMAALVEVGGEEMVAEDSLAIGSSRLRKSSDTTITVKEKVESEKIISLFTSLHVYTILDVALIYT